MSRAAMSYWLLNLCSMTNGLPKHWSLLLIWFLITNNNTLVHLCLQLRGCQSLCTLRLGFLLYLLYVSGYNTSHSEHPLDVLLIATTPTLAQLVFIVSLTQVIVVVLTDFRPSARPLGWIQSYLYKLARHFTTPFVSTCPLCILIRSFNVRSHFIVQCLRPCSVSLIPLLSPSPSLPASNHLWTYFSVSGLCTWGSQFFPPHAINIFCSSSG